MAAGLIRDTVKRTITRMKIDKGEITALVLAGGRGRRMGGVDKGLVELDGQPLVGHLIHAIAPQVGALLISANRNRARYRAFGYPVVSDELDGFQGPLAGFLAGMKHIPTPWMITVPCDAPLLPADYVRRMADALAAAGTAIAVAHDGSRLQPVHALIARSLYGALARYLAGGDRQIERWYRQQGAVAVDFSDHPDVFRNLNTAEERDRLEREHMPGVDKE